MGRDWLGLIRRGLRKPPKVIIQRLLSELSTEVERFVAPQRAQRFGKQALLKATNADCLDTLWERLGNSPYPAQTKPNISTTLDAICPEDRQIILARAELALNHQVNLLGSGLINLGAQIDWHQDYKTGISWQSAYIRDIQYSTPCDRSDVKIPWEISRLQWLMPVGQAYLLTQDESYAIAVKNVLDSWITDNPYAYSVNWTCTMEVALRILSWTWFFRVFHQSDAWRDAQFRERFLSTLFLHGDFTERHLEYSDINGNHYTADAAGLVFAGLFFGEGTTPQRWQKLGWDILQTELPRQVFRDGVDFEASVPYHRLVLELFFLPAYYREICGLDIPNSYRERIINMAQFATIYSRPWGTVPLWGDADDARALPLGTQALNDHRYLTGIVGVAWQIPELSQFFGGTRSEIFWLLGSSAAASLPQVEQALKLPSSTAFVDGGFFIMRNPQEQKLGYLRSKEIDNIAQDHIFIDCGPVGLGGRGGHGHNDCLAFEAVLNGVQLISDCGAYLYTASYEERNHFRSTAYHNTPQVDGEEINRFIRPDYLWNLHNDAQPELRYWQTNTQQDIFCGSHSGYQRLADPVTPVRTLILDHGYHALIIQDRFEGKGEHQFIIPLHLAPDVVAQQQASNKIHLQVEEQTFILIWNKEDEWQFTKEEGRISPSYGVVNSSTRLVWQRQGNLETELVICLMPMSYSPLNPLEWALQSLATRMA